MAVPDNIFTTFTRQPTTDNRKMLIVSNYHYIRKDFTAPHPSIFGLTPKQFRMQLEELSKYGSFISGAELINFRKREFDRNYFLISFDDGLREQYELAKPILDEMGIPVMFFINTSNFEEKEVSLVHKIHLLRSQLSSEELLQALNDHNPLPLDQKEKVLAISHYNYDPEGTAVLKYLLNFKMSLEEQQGFIDPLFRQIYNEEKIAAELYFNREMLHRLHEQDSLGSHSHRHIPLGKISAKELNKELEQSQSFFRSNFGKNSNFISYPYGSAEASLGISAAVEKAGFQIGFSMERAGNKSLQKDSLLLARYDCNDLPLGKNDLFKGKDPFLKTNIRKWHRHENNSVDK